MRAEGTSLSVLATVVTTMLGWQVLTANDRAAVRAPSTLTLDTRIAQMAEAVAIAEGYYAPGNHDGHSLPYRLNNPGGLKKPALGAADLPTWKDTGLVFFPTPDMGWAALRRQLRGMLTGASRLYDLSDTLLHVAVKYADGDLNWGVNVATQLGVAPTITVADLGAPR
jgi:hypothetical protein